VNRRSFLRTLGAGTALTAAGVAGAHPTVTDPATPPEESAPEPLSTLEVANAREAVVGDDGLVYLAATDGFLVVDVSDPADPTVVFETHELLGDREDGPMANVYGVAVGGDRLLVVGPANPGFDAVHGAVLFDVSDPAAPERVGVHETDCPIHNACLAGGLAYLTGNGTEGNPLVIVDVGDGEVGRWSLFDRDDAWREVAAPMRVLHDVTVRDGLAYLAYWDAGTWILDVSEPASPAVVSRVRGRDPGTLAELDPRIEATRPPGNDHRAAVGPDGDLLGINAESWAVEANADRGPGGVEFYDVSDPTEPVRLSRIDPPSTPDPTRGGVWTTSHNFQIVDGRCYTSWYQGGVKVHDVSDPLVPRELYHWRDAGRARFWTAQRLPAGDAFVASSMGVPSEDGAPGGLFAFPDPPSPDDSRASASSPSTEAEPSGGTGDARTLGLLGLGAAAVGVWARLR